MDLSYSAEDEAFRAEIRAWLEEQPDRRVRRRVKGLGGPGKDHEAIEERLAWNRHLAAHGWTGVGWPEEHGGRGLLAVAAGDLPRGVRPGGRARRGSTTSARSCSGRR